MLEMQTMNEQEQMQFFHEIFDASLPRLGPGDDASTIKALDALLGSTMLQGGPYRTSSELRILDLGCGNGAQTIQLARHTEGSILAVDNHQSYLDELRSRAEAEGVSERIQLHLEDMAKLQLPEKSFDLVWSEGALFAIGFREGLQACHRFLKPGGFLAVTELCWLRADAPDECKEFFARVYPAIADIDANLGSMRACGYEILGHFILPESAWWDQYYRPLEDRLRSMRPNTGDPEKLHMLEGIQAEIDIYRKYSKYYGYVFYLMQRSRLQA